MPDINDILNTNIPMRPKRNTAMPPLAFVESTVAAPCMNDNVSPLEFTVTPLASRYVSEPNFMLVPITAPPSEGMP